jgi:2-iminobutanoate/2-iminopropanoate deaminase
MKEAKRCITVPGAPPAVGPYSHAVAANGFLFVSGQIPLAPDGSGPVRGTLEEEAERALENLKILLEGAGSSLEQIVKMTVYLSDMENFARMNEVYKKYFKTDCPARTCFQVARLPLDFQIEVEAIALLPAS